jgi:hypothetical protein
MDVTRSLRRASACLACVAGLAMCLAPGALAQAPPNDLISNARPLAYGSVDAAIDNTFASLELPQFHTCITSDGHETNPILTVYWSLVGSGRPVTITDVGTPFDSTLWVMPGGACDDRDPNETLTNVPTQAGEVYTIEVGACGLLDNKASNCGAPLQGQVRLLATTPPPPNDNRAAAQTLTTGTMLSGDNFGATEEPGETTTCLTAGQLSPYGATVWYTWHAPAAGKVVFNAVGAATTDTVLAVYRADSAAPLRCDDDPARAGPSRIEMPVTAGDYHVQVGGYAPHDLAFIPDSEGQVTTTADFTPDPVAPAPPSLAPNTSAPRVLAEPHLTFDLYDRATGISRISVTDVPAGARIAISCSGPGCTLRTPKVLTTSTKRARMRIALRALKNARFRHGAVLKIVISKAGATGRVLTWTFGRTPKRSRTVPTRVERCLPPGASKPVRCPGG